MLHGSPLKGVHGLRQIRIAGPMRPTHPEWCGYQDTAGRSARPTWSVSVTSVSGTSKVDGTGPGVSHEHALRPRQGRDRHPPAPGRAPPLNHACADPPRKRVITVAET